MNEIKERLQTLEANLAKHLDATAVSRTTKVPWKALLLREVLSWRMADLARGAFENFEKERLASAIVLTRAAVETSAALWYLCGKVTAVVDAKTVGDIDDYLMRLMGSKSDPDFPQAISVLTFVDRVDKEITGFRHQYHLLSEYAHPNWSGTGFLYLKHNKETLVTDFGANIRKTESPKCIGVVNLSVALAMFERSYNRVADLIPAFTALCESQFGSTQKGT